MPADPVVIVPPGGGEVIGDGPDRRVEILSDVDGLHATWSRFGPGRDGADLHIHRRHTDLFYVLTGELAVRLGIEGDEVPLPAGTLARLPPLVVHGFRNASDADVTYLNLHAPGRGFAAYMRGLRDGTSVDFDQEDPPAEGVRPATDAVIGDAADEEAIRVRELRDARAEQGDGHIASYFALEGPLTLSIGGTEQQAGEGAWAQVAAGVPHAVTGARFLSIHTPGRS